MIDTARGTRRIESHPILAAPEKETISFTWNGDDLQAAEKSLTCALELDPDDFVARFWRAKARATQGDREGAISDLQRAVEVAPNARERRAAQERLRYLMGR